MVIGFLEIGRRGWGGHRGQEYVCESKGRLNILFGDQPECPPRKARNRLAVVRSVRTGFVAFEGAFCGALCLELSD